MGVLLDRMHPRHILIFAAIFILTLYFTAVGFSPGVAQEAMIRPIAEHQEIVFPISNVEREQEAAQDLGDREQTKEPHSSSSEKTSRIKPKKPHIVFILADDLGYNDVSYHGSELRTPNIDKLSAQGIRLENYYVQQMCSPSRSQLMTGRYQIHTGLQHSCLFVTHPSCMPTDLPTLPEKLREAEYTTHLVGKWHLGFYKNECLPLNRGFDTFYGILGGRADHYKHDNNGENPQGGLYTGYDFRDGYAVDKTAQGQYDMDLYTDRASRVIEQHNQSQPLFLYLAYQAIHWPLQAPSENVERFKHIKNDDRRMVAAMADTVDRSVLAIVEKLEERGMWEDTVLVFSSDNGAQKAWGNNWPLRGYKNSLWEGGIRAVGFVVSELLPSSVRGTVSRQLMDMSDWLPTLVEGVAKHQLGNMALDGYNMWDTLGSAQPSLRNEILHNIDPFPNKPAKFSTDITAAIRVGDWKLLTGGPGAEGGVWLAPPDLGLKNIQPPAGDHLNRVWLFNITNDPAEKNDLSNQHKDVVDELMEKLRVYYEGAVPVNFPPAVPQSNPELHGGAWGPYDVD